MSWNTAPALEIEMMENVSKIHSIIPCDFIYCSLIFSNQQDGIRIGPDLQKGRCELIRTNGYPCVRMCFDGDRCIQSLKGPL